MPDALMPQAYAEDWGLSFKDDAPTNSEILLVFGAPGSWRNDDIVELEIAKFIPSNLIILDHDRRAPRDLGQILEKVVRKRVIVID